MDSELNIFLSRALLSIPFKNPKIDISASSLLGDPKANLKAKLYSGNFEATVEAGDVLNAELRGSQINLSQIPQLIGLGITKGKISIDANPLIISNNRVKNLEAKIDIDKLHKPQKTVLPGKMLGSPLDITIPVIKSLTAHTFVKLKDSKISIKPIDIKSSLGAFKGEFTGSLNSLGRISSAKGEFTVNLSKAGSDEFGAFLPLISSNEIGPKDKNFRLVISISPNSSNIRALAIK